MIRAPQFNIHGELQHLLSIEGLSRKMLHHILDMADSFIHPSTHQIQQLDWLPDYTIFNHCIEQGDLIAFEIAAKQLSANHINLNYKISEPILGLLDTLSTIPANILAVQHPHSGATHLLAQHAPETLHIINAGDGCHAHPVHTLLNLLTLHHYQKDFTQFRVALVGDILHSGVARSIIHGLSILGTPETRVIAPKTLLPADIESLGVHVHSNIESGIKDVDAIVSIPIQTHSIYGHLVPSILEYSKTYGLTQERLAHCQPNTIIIQPDTRSFKTPTHPTPIHSPHLTTPTPTTFKIATCMAIISTLLKKTSSSAMTDTPSVTPYSFEGTSDV